MPRAWALRQAFVALLLAWAATCSGATEVLRLQQGDVNLYRRGEVYTYRRNQWFFYACADAEARARRRGPHRVIVHIDAHSDAHAAPVASEPESLEAGSLRALESYAERLSIGSYLFPMLRYGFADEIYWVQPGISCFRGPEETVSFELEARDGRIQPALRPGATPAGVESLTVRAFRGEAVPRAQELGYAYGYETAAWRPGPLTLHCLGLEELAAQARQGRFDDRDVLIDLDLDYFGARGPLEGYGYLSLPRHGQIALGLLGGALPVFYMTRDGRERELTRVCELIERLSPRVIGISESPEHSHLEDLPRLAAGIRARLQGSRPDSIPGARARLEGSRSIALSPECARFVDLGSSRAPRLEVEWGRPPGDSLDVSLYFDPTGLRDRRMTTWRVAGDRTRLTLTLRLPEAGIASLLGPGWNVEIRAARDGAWLYGADFTLDAGGELMRRAVADPARYLSLEPRQIVAEGRARGLPPAQTHRILVAHPGTLDSQCRNLSAYRRAEGTIDGLGR